MAPPFFVPMGILPGAGEGDAMPPDINRLFPMRDLPSARLMKLKAFCLFRAGVLSEQEMTEIREKADAFMRNPRFRSASHPRRAA
jgi:hypothetical protein